jgi:large subunit ribosomal protein L9
MEIVLTKNVEKLGRKGEIKDVKPGYFMNFLAPQGMALKATPARVEWAEKMQEQRVKEKEEITKQAKEIKEKLEETKITFDEKTTDKGTLYGSIGEKEIQKQIEDQAKIKLEKKQIKMPEPIKTTGSHKVAVQLTDVVSVDVTVEVAEKKS